MAEENLSGIYQNLGNLREACRESGIDLPENAFDASAAISSALSASDGDEERALSCLATTFKRGTKRDHSTLEADVKNNRDTGDQQQGEDEEYAEETPEEDESNEERDDVPPRKLSRLEEDVLGRKAAVSSNQVIVDAFTKYGEQQLQQGHTGKGVTHLRAARAICDYPRAITSANEALDVPMVGSKMAAQVEQVLSCGKLEDETPWLNVSSTDETKHKPPRLVQEVRNAQTKRPENQKLVDELAKFGEHELYFRSGSKGTTHLRAARAIQKTDMVITSGKQARRNVSLIGPAIADKIDQILFFGRIVHDSPVSGSRIQETPIVKDLHENPAKRPENQAIVDALTEYGDSHLHSGHRGRGIAHLRAAKAIRDADEVVTSGEHAVESLKYVGLQVKAKIDQILKQGNTDTEDDEDDDDQEEGSEFGDREPTDTAPIVHEVRSKSAQVKENQELVDAITAQGEKQLAKWHTSQGTAFMRAARRLRDAAELVTSGSVARALGCIGNKVEAFIETVIVVKTEKTIVVEK